MRHRLHCFATRCFTDSGSQRFKRDSLSTVSMLFASSFEHSGNLIILASSKPPYVDTSLLRLAEKGKISIRYFLLFSFFLRDSSGIKLISFSSSPESWSIFSINLIFYHSNYFSLSFDNFWLDQVPLYRNGILLSMPFTIHNFSKFTLRLLPSNSSLNYTRRGRARISMYIKKKKKCFISSYIPSNDG